MHGAQPSVQKACDGLLRQLCVQKPDDAELNVLEFAGAGSAVEGVFCKKVRDVRLGGKPGQVVVDVLVFVHFIYGKFSVGKRLVREMTGQLF